MSPTVFSDPPSLEVTQCKRRIPALQAFGAVRGGANLRALMPSESAAPLDTAAARAARRRVMQITAEVHEPHDLLRRVIGAVREVVPFQATGWATADPATMLWTGGVVDGFSPRSWASFLDNELLEQDLNKYRDILRRPGAVGVLRPEAALELRSPRYRAMYEPHGLGPELRFAFTLDGVCWGGACLVRGIEAAPFEDREAAFLAGLGRHVAHGLRAAGARAAVGEGHGGPGVMVLADDLEVEAMNSDAERWLRALGAWPAEVEILLASAVGAVVARARACLDGVAGAGPARGRVATRAGWIAVHASALGSDPRRWSVVVEPARPSEAAPLIAHGRGLTPRERQALALLLRGAPDKEIAQRLGVTVHTASEHVKRVLAKYGARSRGELMAAVLADHYEPSGAAVVPLNEG